MAHCTSPTLHKSSLKNLRSAVGSHKSIDFWDGQIMALEIAITELQRDRAVRHQWWRESEEYGLLHESTG